MWYKRIATSNIISGFKRTVMYPPGRDRYPVKRLDARLLIRCTKWVEMEKPRDMFEEASQSVETLQKLIPTSE